MLLARQLHIENILKFLVLYGAANFCTTSALTKDFTEVLRKGENRLAVQFQIMERVSPVLGV